MRSLVGLLAALIAIGPLVLPPTTTAVAVDFAKPWCSQNGKSGPRVQVVYAYVAGQPNRLAGGGTDAKILLKQIRGRALAADEVFAESAARVSSGRDERRILFVHNRDCAIIVATAAVTQANFVDAKEEIKRKFIGRGDPVIDRKYMVFADWNSPGLGTRCGDGETFNDESPDPDQNPANFGPSVGITYATTNASLNCWNHPDKSYPAHELMHTLGALSAGAPFRTGDGHCTDEDDLLCDAPRESPCRLPTGGQYLFDCRGDNYFNPSPAPNSYLATKWNPANSRFLVNTKAPTRFTLRTVDARTGKEVHEACFKATLAGQPGAVRAEVCDQTAGTGSTPCTGSGDESGADGEIVFCLRASTSYDFIETEPPKGFEANPARKLADVYVALDPPKPLSRTVRYR